MALICRQDKENIHGKNMIKHLLVSITLLFSISTHAYEFSWDNLMLAHSKLDTAFDYEVMVDGYMKLYRAPVWKRYKSDEFELEDKRQETIVMMKERIKSFDLDDEFILRTSIDFEQYDFKKEEFPLTKLGSNSYFYKNNSNTYGSGFQRTYKVHFENTEIFGNLAMAKSDAKEFVQKKKTSSGRVKRLLPMEIKFIVIGKSGEGDLKAVIIEVNVFDTDNATLLTTFK